MSDKYYQTIKKLQPEDWNKKIDDNWTVKDVVSHLVGWEREAAIQLPFVWETKRKPWFVENKNYDEFNQKSVEQFSKLTTEELLQEWEMWSQKLEKEIDEITEGQLREYGDLFDWVFDYGDNSHYEYHMREIEEIVKQ